MKHRAHSIQRTVVSVASALLAGAAIADGSGLNVVVVVNESDPDSLALGNYYCERRELAPQNLVRIPWTGSRTDWTRSECEATLIAPLTAQLAERGLGGQIDFVVLSMGFPYRVLDGPDVNSTTSTLFYGFKTNDWRGSSPCRISPEGQNPYCGSELPFHPRPPGSSALRWLTTLLTGYRLDDAMAVVDRGVLSDFAAPGQPVMLELTTDAARNVRSTAFGNAALQVPLAGGAPPVVTNSNQTAGLSGLLGLQTGLGAFDVSPGTFVPGAMADSLTSLGGFLFESTGQTNLLAFLRAGATASYGTVVEPCNYTEKFPDPNAFFYQARGFALAEAYYQSLASPYQGLIVGEPLAAPFARPGSGAWRLGDGSANLTRSTSPRGGLHGPPPDTIPILTGTTNLGLAFAAPDPDHPIGQVDLFVDGRLISTVTNFPPLESNRLSVKINRTVVELNVPADTTLPSLAAALATQITAKQDQTQVTATAIGDRVELVSQELTRAGTNITLTTTQLAGGAAALGTFVRAGRPRFLDSPTPGTRDCEVQGSVPLDGFLRCTLTLTNGAVVVLSVTNSAPAVSTSDLTLRLLNQLWSSPALQGPDGVTAEDLFVQSARQVSFRLVARSPGWPASQVRLEWEASAGVRLDPGTPQFLNQNINDLRPRNHLYVSAGRTNLDLNLAFDTLGHADGFHELAAVAYEGTSVRTQTRATTSIRIRNTPLEATLRSMLPATEVAVEASLAFDVTANRAEIARIDLHGTGGWLAGATNTASAVLAIPGTKLGPGLHRFQALVTATDGSRFLTAPVELRLVARDTPLVVSIATAPLTLSWPALFGRTYEVWSGESAGQLDGLEDLITSPTGGTLQWPVPGPSPAGRFYRIGVQ